MSRSRMLYMAKRFRGMLLREYFEKWCVLVYILIGFFPKIFPKISLFYIKRNDFTCTLAYRENFENMLQMMHFDVGIKNDRFYTEIMML